MKMFKKIVALTVLISFSTTQNIIPLQAHELKPYGKRQLLKQVEMKKGKIEAEGSIVRIAPGKFAVLVKFPIRSKAKVQKLELISPSGKKYKARSVRSMPSRDIKTYLDDLSSTGGKLKGLCRGVGSLLVPEAHASCGSCGSEGSSGEDDSREGAAANAAFFGLLSGAMQENDVWYTVCFFEITEESGQWELVLTYYDEGKRGRIKKKITLAGAPEELLGEGPAWGKEYDPGTGVTTVSRENPDGSHTVTKYDEDGNVISEETFPAPDAPTDQGDPTLSGGRKPGVMPGELKGPEASPKEHEVPPKEGPETSSKGPEAPPEEGPEILPEEAETPLSPEKPTETPPEKPVSHAPEEFPKEPPSSPPVKNPPPKIPKETPPHRTPPKEPETPPKEPPPKEKELLCCRLNGGYIVFPNTIDYLMPPNVQEAWNNPATGACNIFLHDSSFFSEEHPLYVQSVGLDFDLTMVYRSNIKTTRGGMYGYKWDMNYNKRIVPQGGRLLPGIGMRIESLSAPGDMAFYNGCGRRDLFRHKHSERRVIRNYGNTFHAFVSTYEAPAGLFAELKRYVVTSGSGVPFSKHPNFEGQIFYVMRYKHGEKDVFSCRGTLLYSIDRNENRMTFIYDLARIHPLTFNPVLVKVIDTVGREYNFSYLGEKTSDVLTNYRGKVIRGPYPILRLSEVEDFDGRKVLFSYEDLDNNPELKAMEELKDRKKGSTRYTYGTEHLVETITQPREVANEGPPVLTNYWQGAAVIRQLHGLPGKHTVTDSEGVVGGTWKITRSSPGPEGEIKVIDRRGNPTVYALKPISDSYVVSEYVLPSGESDQGRLRFSLDYNKDYQITFFRKPAGNFIKYEYDTKNESITQGDVRDWLDRGLTYENDLSKGNLLKKTLFAGTKKHGLSYSEISVTYDYEHLFNQAKRIEGPGDTVTIYAYKHGTFGKPGNNGNPSSRINPKRTRAEGKPLTDITNIYLYNDRGQIYFETDPAGHESSYHYDKFGYLDRISTVDSEVSYLRDNRGNTLEYIDELGTVTQYEVNQRDKILRKLIDVNGFRNEVSYEHDLNGNLIKMSSTVKDNFKYFDKFKDVKPQSPLKLEAAYSYNLLNKMSSETHRTKGLERTYRYAYDASENLTRIFSPVAVSGTDINHYIDMEYTPNDLPEKIIRGGRGKNRVIEICRYDVNGNIKSKTLEGEDQGARFETDGFDRPFLVITPEGTEIRTYLTPGGERGKIRIRGADHAGAISDLLWTEFHYDELKSVIQVDEHILGPSGEETGKMRIMKYVRDKEGKVVKKIDPEGNATSIKYLGHRKWIQTDPMGNQVIYSYDKAGNVTEVVEKEKEVEFFPSSGGLKPRRSFSESSSFSMMEYDSLGRLASLLNSEAGYTYYAYDSSGNVRAVLYPGGRLDMSRYDGFGRKLDEMDFYNLPPDLRTSVHSAYDLNDRLMSLERHERGGAVKSYAYEYTSLDLLKSMTVDGKDLYSYGYDNFGNMVKEVLANGISAEKKYDKEGRLIFVKAKYPASPGSQWGSREDTFKYDGMGRVTEATRYGGFVENEMMYNSLGLLVQESQSIGNDLPYTHTVYYEYDDRGLKVGMKLDPLPGYLEKTPRFNYKYDPLGRIVLVTNVADGAGEELKYDYTGAYRVARRRVDGTENTFYYYDNARRLAKARIYSGKLKKGKTTWSGEWKYTDLNLLKSSSFKSHLKGVQVERMAAYEYTPFYAFSRSTKKETDKRRGKNEWSYSREDRANLFMRGRLNETYSYVQTYSDDDGDEIKTEYGVKSDYDYENDRANKISFSNYGDIERGLKRDPDIIMQMSGEADSRQTNVFLYDNNGNLTGDERYRYSYDYGDRVGRVLDKYNFTRDFKEECYYYYDYKGRLVYISHQPSDKKHIQVWRRNTRILYDGTLPLAEIATGFDSSPEEVNAFYVTHPDGRDIGSVLLREDDSGEFKKYLPFFDGQGRLVQVANSGGDPCRISYEYPEPDTMSHLEHVLKDPAGGSVRFSLTSLHTRWEAIPELEMLLSSGRFVMDQSRNVEKQADNLIQEQLEYLNTKITEGHKQALLLMSVLFIPFLFVSTSVLFWSGVGVAVDFLTAKAMGDEYTWEDAALTFLMGAPFEAFSFEMRVMEAFINARRSKLIESFLASRGTKEALNLSSDLFEGAVRSGGRLKKASERISFWRTHRAGLEDYVWGRAMHYLQDAVEAGNPWARDLMEDISSRRVIVLFDPGLAARGKYRAGTKILLINPMKSKNMGLRSVKEITSTVLHEYVHFRGFNEFRAYKEQYLYLLQVLDRRKLPPEILPTLGKNLRAFKTVLDEEGMESALECMEQYSLKKAMRRVRGRKMPWRREYIGSARGGGNFNLLRKYLIESYGDVAVRSLPRYEKLIKYGLPIAAF